MTMTMTITEYDYNYEYDYDYDRPLTFEPWPLNLEPESYSPSDKKELPLLELIPNQTIRESQKNCIFASYIWDRHMKKRFWIS